MKKKNLLSSISNVSNIALYIKNTVIILDKIYEKHKNKNIRLKKADVL